MPELPEVETVRQILRPLVINKKISGMQISYSKIIKEISPDLFEQKLMGQKIVDINRNGKYLVINFGTYNLAIHLRMEGKLFYYHQDRKMEKHDHIKIIFTDGSILLYNDTRKFGTMHLVHESKMDDFIPITKLGIEPHSDQLTVKYLTKKFQTLTKPIKQTLLDQTIVNGLGNIYVDEVLFRSKIHPQRATNQITQAQIKRIINSCKIVIEQAIENGGTTIKSFAVSEGNSGRFQQELRVYGRKNQKCYECGTIIEKIKVGGRGTHFCPKCQRR